MKKLFVLFVLLVGVLSCVTAQTIYYRNQATLQWDAVTVDAEGEPFLPTDVVEYEVYIYDHIVGVADPQNVTLLTSVGTTAAVEQLIVFPYRTTWAAGVRTKVTDAGANVVHSPLAWSYVSTDAGVAGPFLYVPSPTLRAPLNLRDSGM